MLTVKDKQDVRTIVCEELSSIEQAVNGHTSDIKELKSDVKELKSDVKGLKSDVKGLKSDVKELNADTTKALVLIEEINGTIKAVAENMDFVRSRYGTLESLDGRVSELEVDVKILKSN